MISRYETVRPVGVAKPQEYGAEPKQPVTVKCPKSLVKAIKDSAAKSGKTFSAALIDALKLGLNPSKEEVE